MPAMGSKKPAICATAQKARQVEAPPFFAQSDSFALVRDDEFLATVTEVHSIPFHSDIESCRHVPGDGGMTISQ